MKTFVIAEAGANHNRNFNQAKALIDVASNSGASACKFQTYSSETLYSKHTPDFAGYTNINKLIKDIELPREWQKDLKQYCDESGIEFMSTPFDEKAVEELIDIGVKRLKISGFESTDFRFVEMVASTKLPLIISLGIGFHSNFITGDKDTDLIRLFEIINKHENDLTLLHCNNAYPTPIEDCGLYSVKRLSSYTQKPPIGAPWKLPFKTGLSDHTRATSIPAIAVALGADVIEKHFTLSRNLSGPDHSFALEPTELKQMISLINKTEKSMDSPSGQYSKSEIPFISARRSVVAKRKIKKGEEFTANNITTKRPFLKGNVVASEWFNILEKTASADYNIDDFIRE